MWPLSTSLTGPQSHAVFSDSPLNECWLTDPRLQSRSYQPLFISRATFVFAFRSFACLGGSHAPIEKLFPCSVACDTSQNYSIVPVPVPVCVGGNSVFIILLSTINGVRYISVYMCLTLICHSWQIGLFFIYI